MEQWLGLAGIAVVLFAATNVDDIFVLLGFFSDPHFRTRHVIVGQFAGIGVLFGVSVVASLISLVIPRPYLGLLGLAPIAIGVMKLWALRRGSKASEEPRENKPTPAAHGGNILAVAAVTIANGGDNIGVYTPVFATRAGYEIAVIGAVFAVMTAVWIAFAHWLVNHRTIGAPIRAYGRRVVPFVLIALGALIFYEADTLSLLR